MKKAMTFHRKKIWLVFLICAVMMLGMIGRLVYLMGFQSDYYYQKAAALGRTMILGCPGAGAGR